MKHYISERNKQLGVHGVPWHALACLGMACQGMPFLKVWGCGAPRRLTGSLTGRRGLAPGKHGGARAKSENVELNKQIIKISQAVMNGQSSFEDLMYEIDVKLPRMNEVNGAVDHAEYQ